MTIATRYDPKQEIWFMYNNKPTMRTVLDVDITLSPTRSRALINYEVAVDRKTFSMPEEKCYGTKEELINDL